MSYSPQSPLTLEELAPLLATLPSPCYAVDLDRLEANLEILGNVQKEAGCKILLAQKAFSFPEVYPQIARHLAGTTASGLYEARLGYEEMPGKEVHVYKPAYLPGEVEELTHIAGHILFNSFAQWEKYREVVLSAPEKPSCGLRVNPEHSTQEGHAIYDPCAPGSRLGITAAEFKPELLHGIEGLHMHTLCEQGADALAETLPAFEEKFGKYLHGMKWLNLGGGHHITRPDYDRELLVREVRRLRETYGVEVYLEPGEAVALNVGYLSCRVLDVVRNGIDIAIVDTSAACHMPDVLEMPYRPNIIGSAEPGEKAHTYRLGGPTCLAGDIIGDYSFDRELRPGDQLVFTDMAIYSFCKNNTFNGMPLPALGTVSREGGAKVVKAFGYENFKVRLGKG